MKYSERLNLLYGICCAEAQQNAGKPPRDVLQSTNLDDYDPLDSATFLACFITFKAIQHAGRSPAEERQHNFDMLSVYQAYAMMILAYFTLPLGGEGIAPDLVKSSVVLVKTLFAGVSEEEWAEIIEAGQRKFQLVGNAEEEHWAKFREELDKAVVAYLVAGTDDDAPFEKEEIVPLFSTLLSGLCEAFES